jgi:hypothetical protein
VRKRSHKSGAGVLREARGENEGGRATKRPQKWRRSFTRSSGRERRGACYKETTKVAPEFYAKHGETAKGGVLQRGHKSGAAVSSNSDMQIGVPAEYCTTQNPSELIGKILNKVGGCQKDHYVNEVHKLQNWFQMKRIMRGKDESNFQHWVS